ncbi:MAG: dihydroorotase [Ruminococcaceae bacterium]|nr:dihydroorotase [Oscillospiraceae bacterium]
MKLLLKGGKVFHDGGFVLSDVLISEGKVFLSSTITESDTSDADVIDISNKYVFPGFTDVHIHLREPGFSYKETIRTGSLAAAAGGYTAVFAMPNVAPPPDSAETLKTVTDIIDRDAVTGVYQYGCITAGRRGEKVAPLEEMTDAVAFTDDGSGVQTDEIMLEAMERAKKLGKIIAAHCEDNSLLNGGYIHDGEYAKAHGHRGICSESEWGPIQRDVELARRTGCPYHVCHVSAKESVDIIRKAKADGVDITAETAPHYLVFDDSMLEEDGRFKMNPPIRAAADREALIEGIIDGTIDMIATDHAPHSAEEKSRGLEGSAMGVVGLETAFPVMYTYLVKTGKLTMARLVELMATAPAERFSVGEGIIRDGGTADLCVYDLDREYEIDPETFMSKGRSTPFKGMRVNGKCIMTVKKGKVIWTENLTER